MFDQPRRPFGRRALLKHGAKGALAASLPGWCRVAQARSDTSGELEVLHAFAFLDGAGAVGGQAFGTDGALQGMQARGGEQGLGTLTRWSPADGQFAVTHVFRYSATDGFVPGGGLMRAADGTLWGTTLGGGEHFEGTLFSVDPDGTYTTRTSFGPTGKVGTSPMGGLVQGPDGHLYGTTGSAVYRFGPQPGGRLKALHVFTNAADGFGSQASLTMAPGGGGLLGCNFAGGPAGHGTIFWLKTDGTAFTVLKAFAGGDDGDGPVTPLLFASDGHFYGTTPAGGKHRQGVVFRLSAHGRYEVLHHFRGGTDDGAFPYSGLIEGPDGSLYGSTSEGGAAPSGFGTLYRLHRGTGLTLIHRFRQTGAAGYSPAGLLTLGPDGVVYGTTQEGAAEGQGALFRLRG